MLRKFYQNSKYLLTFIHKICPSYFWTILLVTMTAFVGPLSTVLLPKLITDELLGDFNVHRIVIMVVIVALANIVRAVVRTLFNESYVPFQQNKVTQSMNSLLMRQSVKLDLESYDDPSFYDQYTRALKQAESGLISFMKSLAMLFDRFFYIITVISIVFVLEPALIVLSGICVYILFFFSKKQAKYRYQTNRATTKFSRIADYAKRIYYQPEYAKEMRTTALGDIMRDRYTQACEQQRSTVRQRSHFLGFLIITDEGLRIIILQIVTMIYLVMRIQSGQLEVSSFVALFLATMQLSYEFFSFVNCLNDFYRLSLDTDDLRIILEYKSRIEHSAQPRWQMGDDIESLDINAVTFSYKDNPGEAIKDVTISICKNQHIALVGYNGAGKTTLTKLLLRLYDPTDGSIQINGKDIREFDVASIRDMIGVVYQDYRYYGLTIAENILMKRVECQTDRDRVNRALQQSDLYDFIHKLPNGIDTLLTREFDDKGVVLSGGQSQKLALARMFVQNDKRIFIMDEASSALDPISEHKINKRIIEFCQDRILILISHRLSTTKDVDCIYYLEEGKVIERGTHEQLLAVNGKYAEMYNVQLEAYRG